MKFSGETELDTFSSIENVRFLEYSIWFDNMMGSATTIAVDGQQLNNGSMWF